MGASKLLLPWHGQTVIQAVLSAWRASPIDCIAVVLAPDDEPLAAAARDAGALVVLPPLPPPDMKASVLAGLDYVQRCFAPQPADHWLLAPADLPRLSTAAIHAVLTAAGEAGEHIVVPTYAGRRGHPIALPWALAAQVGQLGPGQGIDQLVALSPVIELPIQDAGICEDLDTLDDYHRLHGSGPA